jgi:hypothetical protein
MTGEPHYIGADKCAKMCHKSEKKGAQLKKWRSLKHSKAWEVLATPEAKKVAQEAGVEGDPQKLDACLKCHVTAFGVKPELIDSTFKIEDGVQCEGCHGPGSKYAKMSIMKNKEKSMSLGLIEADKKLCETCHNATAPGFPGFDYETAVKKISHLKPKPAK